ncbi:MAG: DUF4270 domain-containing protein [Flavobacteriaceae bacterium]|jgi:hypothetical protein|nr:DUF4270 domain-containing protein [Flavobacteriaceae bacterium]MBT3754397.1 DUF4270 domain-containing protein [Flavobacteriaceae bacterium]MBT3794768.1 DUF4270 domain-containing protein [Flavobacteriaceae bacterium]MBT4062616.1 DUF4270 domain-containing protein [Flavobacteriaceae bacterium]MBT4246342.1 DUF4270 domain-containing protein [Flavobacteriaceae bacterium]
MNYIKFLFVLLLFMTSCNKDYNTVGVDLIDNKPFNTDIEEVPVFVKMNKIPPYIANAISTFQLGIYEDNIYGKSKVSFLSQLSFDTPNAVFGIFSPTDEINGMEDNIAAIPELETIKDVFLDIPFFTNVDDDDNDGVINLYDVDSEDPYSDSDGDGVSDSDESNSGQDPLNPDTDGDGILDGDDTESINPNAGATLYELDSLMGNSEAKFKLKVSELDYFLRPFDPENNFETYQKYYSSNSIPDNFSGTVLFDEEIEINSKELVFYKEDDPETEDDDESEIVKERLTPRIRVSLDKDFFQSKILDNEGSDDLANAENFKLFFKGIIIDAYDFSDPLLMILNFSEAEIRIVYDYQKYDKNDTDDDTSDDVIESTEDEYKLNLNGIKLNSFKYDLYPAEIITAISDTINNAGLVYLKGGEGIMAEIELFKDDNGNDLLEEIRKKEWLVNEASLSIYINKDMLSSSGGIIEPSRLYLYDIDNKAPLIDYFVDNSAGPKEYQNKIVHGGSIELDEDKNGLMYKIRISEHIKNVIRKDSTNTKLGLVVSSDISNTINVEVETKDLMTFIPNSTAINPLGTVLIGPSPSAEYYEKRMKLDLYYTKLNN